MAKLIKCKQCKCSVHPDWIKFGTLCGECFLDLDPINAESWSPYAAT